MRVTKQSGKFAVRAISGTRVVLMAWDIDDDALQGLQGFAIQHASDGKPGKWLPGIKYFTDLVPAPVAGATYSSREHPFQTFLWSDYTLEPGTTHQFTIAALYGTPGDLTERYTAKFEIKTEKANDGKHGIWFNRGAIASHALAAQFQNKQITDDMFNALDDDGHLLDPEVAWLSRGLAEACLDLINGTQAGEALRVCAYEFTYAPVLNALKEALKRGVDVRIVYHDTKSEKDPNVKAIKLAKLTKTAKVNGKSVQILFPRTRTKIPHNKFIVKIKGGKPQCVWTGSTNFTSTGFFGQTNVGHLVTNPVVAKTYLACWEALKDDPTLSNAVKSAMALTPNPPNAPSATRPSAFFSPRLAQNMLDWYAQRLDDANSLAVMTIPFNVAPEILTGLSVADSCLRLVILEDPPSQEVLAAEKANKGRLAFSNGAILGKNFDKLKSSFGGAHMTEITKTPLEKWFLKEELARPVNSGHVFFVHSKFLMIDPLSDDPLVCSGSANFSKGSLISNDENMLLIRGDTRVADIYLTEFDRIFRHFYARDATNAAANKGNKKNPLELDATGAWIRPYFKAGNFKNTRRQVFFPPKSAAQQPSWSDAADSNDDPFADELEKKKANAKPKPT